MNRSRVDEALLRVPEPRHPELEEEIRHQGKEALAEARVDRGAHGRVRLDVRLVRLPFPEAVVEGRRRRSTARRRS